MARTPSVRVRTTQMKRRNLILAMASLPLGRALPAGAATPAILVFKNTSCGCCGAWVEHLAAAGFEVSVKEVADTGAVRRRLGLPEQYGSCHTATVAGYVLEGHVPAADVRRLLADRPVAIGLAVPGMPVGSPGMEVGSRVDPYEVLLVDRKGKPSVFARYPER